MEFVPSPAIHRVLCADCGTAIEPNGANLCVACLRNTVDITEGIPKQGESLPIPVRRAEILLSDPQLLSPTVEIVNDSCPHPLNGYKLVWNPQNS